MKLRTEGLKGHDADVTLARLVTVVAPNGSGKSSLSEAIRFAVLGYSPAFGKRPQDTAALLRGRRMSVDWQIDDLHTISRVLTAKEDGGYQTTVSASWVKRVKGAQPHQEILQLFGRDEQDIAEMLDVRELLGLSPNLRAARLQALLAAASATPEELAAEIAAQTVMRLANVAPERMPEDYRTLMPLLSDGMRAALKGLAPTLLAKLRETGIAGVCEWSNGLKREHAAAAKNKAAAAHELGERLAGLGEAAAEEIARIETERNRLRGELGGAQERNRAAIARQATIAAAAGELDRAREKLQAAKLRRETVSREVVEHARDPRRLVEIEAELDTMQAPVPEEQPEAAELLARAAAEEEKARGVVMPEPTFERSAGLRETVDSLVQQIEAVQESPWRRVREIAVAIEADAVGKSGRIQRLQALASELCALADAHAPNAEDLQIKLIDAQSWLTDALAEERTQAEERQRREETRENYLHVAKRCRAAANELLTAAAQTYEQARAEFASRRAPLVAERDALRVGIDRRRQDAADADTALARAEEAFKAATQRAEDLGQAPDEIVADTASLEAQLAELTGRLSEHARQKAARDELTALVDELERAQVLRDVFTALEWAAQQVRAQQVTEAGGPLKAHMRRFLTAAGRKEEPFFHAAGGVCDLGWITPAGDEVLVQALSGAEWVLYTTALVYAMLMLRAPLVRVLLVDAGHCDDQNTVALMQAIEAVSEDLTLALVEHYREPAQVSEAWQVVRLSNGRAAVAA